jgi:hypothetical protein
MSVYAVMLHLLFTGLIERRVCACVVCVRCTCCLQDGMRGVSVLVCHVCVCVCAAPAVLKYIEDVSKCVLKKRVCVSMYVCVCLAVCFRGRGSNLPVAR